MPRKSGPLDGLASLDPTGVMPRLVPFARRLPGVGMLERQLERAEQALLTDLRRLEAGSPAAPAENGAAPAAPQEILDDLLTRSMHQSPDESLQALVTRTLGEIVPDEARILAALADGSAYPLVHVHRGAAGGGERVLANASSVGRAAGVALPTRVPNYVSRLLALGLAETGPEATHRNDDYEVLTTDEMVRGALAEARKNTRRPPRIVRRTLRISELGRELWLQCRPQDSTDFAAPGQG